MKIVDLNGCILESLSWYIQKNLEELHGVLVDYSEQVERFQTDILIPYAYIIAETDFIKGQIELRRDDREEIRNIYIILVGNNLKYGTSSIRYLGEKLRIIFETLEDPLGHKEMLGIYHTGEQTNNFQGKYLGSIEYRIKGYQEIAGMTGDERGMSFPTIKNFDPFKLPFMFVLHLQYYLHRIRGRRYFEF